MPFDPKTAKDIGESAGGGFDISTAKDAAPEKSDNLYSRFYGNLTAKETKPLGMAIGPGDAAVNPAMTLPRLAVSAMGIPEEDMLPVLGQMAGGRIAGGFGSTVGATAGQGVRQMLRPMRGEKTDIGAIGTEALITGALEGVTRGASGLLFRRSRAKDLVENGVGKALAEAKNQLRKASASNPKLQINGKEIVTKIDDALNGINDKSAAGAALLRRWKGILGTGKPVTAGQLMEFEELLGKSAKFATQEAEKIGKVSNSVMNKSLKELRTFVSDKVDNLAEQSGIGNFKQMSDEVSQALKTLAKRPSVLRTLIASGALGGIVGTTTANPAIGYVTSGAVLPLTSGTVRRGLFNAIDKTGVGRGATLGLSETARRILSEKQ